MNNGHTNPRFFTNNTIVCIKCKEIKAYSEFHKDTNKYGVAYYCKLCANKNARKHHSLRVTDINYKSAKRSDYFKNRYNLSLVQYLEKLKAQNYLCAICGVRLPESGPHTHLDHCHKTGQIRAFLCTNCNRGLGHFQDSILFLDKASDYLKIHNSNVDGEKEVLCL